MNTDPLIEHETPDKAGKAGGSRSFYDQIGR